MKLAHEWSDSSRTVDVAVNDEVTFSGMMLCEEVLKGLTEAGFRKPSPVQLQAIPIGRCGFDLIVEAKSGTGKTAVFGIISLEMIEIRPDVQVLILAPTREIAVQVCEVIRTLGSAIKGLYVETVMGGTSCLDDIKRFSQSSIPQIVVGSPGRLRHLVQQNVIDTSAVRLLVLDEADKLMEGSFQADINYINSKLENKQVIAASATYSEELRTFIGRYMKSPSHVRPDNSCILLGVSQSITVVKHHENILKQIDYKYAELKEIISSVNFKQCLVFCNYQARSKKICTLLKRDGWPAEYLSGCQTQDERLRGLRSLQEFKCRVLVATDLAARGLDASNVDLVLNFEPPYEVATYLHRIGRAGRYGSYGSAITILSCGTEEAKFKEQLRSIGDSIKLTDFRSKSSVLLNELQVQGGCTEYKISDPADCLNNSISDHNISEKIETELNFEDLLDSFNHTKSPLHAPLLKNIEFPTFKHDKNDTINLDKLSACVESLFNSQVDNIKHPEINLKNSALQEDKVDDRYKSIEKLCSRVESLFNTCIDTKSSTIAENNIVTEINLQENNRTTTQIDNESRKADLNETMEREFILSNNVFTDQEMSIFSHEARSKLGTRKNKKIPVPKSKYSFDEHLHSNKVDYENSNMNLLKGADLPAKKLSYTNNKFEVCENQIDKHFTYNNNANYFARNLQTSDSEHEGLTQVEDKHKKTRNKPAGQRHRSTHSAHQNWDKSEEITTSLALMDYDTWRAQLAMMTAQIEQSVFIKELCNQ